MTRNGLLGVVVLMLAALLLCPMVSAAGNASLPSHGSDTLLIATTTSLDGTGILDQLKDTFEKENGVKVLWTAVGTGQAIETAKNCNVDVVMVHDKAAEDKFISDGYGLDRRTIGYNYFIILGPESDPAKIKGKTATEAFKAINDAAKADNSIVFVSRGDGSGTHSKEKNLWKAAKFDYATVNSSPWYKEAGSGMGPTLIMTNELQGYTISDTASYGAQKANLTIVPLVEESDDLLNVYDVMRVNPEKCADVNVDLGKKWINYLISDDTQKLIAEYGTQKYGKPLFNASKGAATYLNVTEDEISKTVE